MVTWIFIVLGLLLVQIFLPAGLRLSGGTSGLGGYAKVALGNRDELPPAGLACARAERALRNLGESLPFFLTLALLALIEDKDQGLALTGAAVFAIARIAYLPAYLMGIFAVRSLLWTAGLVGIAMMAIGVAS